MTRLAFTKMHGLGNDFVILDGRATALDLSAGRVRALADRKTGIGCDQLIAIEPPVDGRAAAFMRIWNADGSEVEACGNASRCVASLLMTETGRREVVIETGAGLLEARDGGADGIIVDIGPARLGWREIPLARETETLHVDVRAGPLSDAVAVNVGNPHAVFFVADAGAVPLAEVGPALETDPLFPERANIGVAEVVTRRHMRVRVWERGVGITRACGTGACAAVVAGARRGLTERDATVTLDGGALGISWRDDGHVVMAGPAALSFVGEIGA